MAKNQGIEELETPIVVCNEKVYMEVTYEQFIVLVNS